MLAGGGGVPVTLSGFRELTTSHAQERGKIFMAVFVFVAASPLQFLRKMGKKKIRFAGFFFSFNSAKHKRQTSNFCRLMLFVKKGRKIFHLRPITLHHFHFNKGILKFDHHVFCLVMFRCENVFLMTLL